MNGNFDRTLSNEDVLRRRASSAFLMGSETPRARALGMLRLERGLDADAVAALYRALGVSTLRLQDFYTHFFLQPAVLSVLPQGVRDSVALGVST